MYRLYDAVTPDDIQHVAVTYFPETNRTDVTLTQAAPDADGEEAGQ